MTRSVSADCRGRLVEDEIVRILLAGLLRARGDLIAPLFLCSLDRLPRVVLALGFFFLCTT